MINMNIEVSSPYQYVVEVLKRDVVTVFDFECVFRECIKYVVGMGRKCRCLLREGTYSP